MAVRAQKDSGAFEKRAHAHLKLNAFKVLASGIN